jgi:hypothetical protein
LFHFCFSCKIGKYSCPQRRQNKLLYLFHYMLMCEMTHYYGGCTVKFHC